MKLEKPRNIVLPTAVHGLALAPDQQHLYASCLDGLVYQVDIASGEKVPFEGKHSSFASGCVILPDGKTLITSGYDGWLVWHDVETKKPFRRLKAHDFWSWQLALSPDGSLVASVTGQYLVGGEKYEPAAASEPTVRIYDTQTGDLVREFQHGPPVLSVAFSPDSKYVAVGNMMGEVVIWKVASGISVSQFKSPDFTSWGIIKSPHYIGGIYGLAFAPDGGSLLCCGMGPMGDPMAGNGKMTWQRWAWRDMPPKMMEQIRDGEHGSGLMETITHAPDGSYFLMAGRQAQGTWTTAAFSTTDGKLLASLDTSSRVTRSVFSADGKTAYLGGATGQPARDKEGKWPEYGRIHVVVVTA